jgi:hypothetical protein
VIVFQIAGVEHDDSAVGIKKEAPVAEPEAKGALAVRHIGKFLDIVFAPAVVGISPQDGEGLVSEKDDHEKNRRDESESSMTLFKDTLHVPGGRLESE